MQLRVAAVATVKESRKKLSTQILEVPVIRLTATALLAAIVAGCNAHRPPYIPPSQGHIMAPAPQAEIIPRDIPPPARVSTFVPPPKPAIKPLTYSVVVNEVPVKELLLALSRDTKQNIDVHPGITGLVSLNAINETLPAILERVSKQVSIRLRFEGNTILVGPDAPYSRTYRIDYVNMARNSTSITSMSGQIGGSGTQAAPGQASQTATAQQSSTSISTVSANDFWKTLETTLRGILSSSVVLSRQEKAENLAIYRQEQQIRLEEARSRSAATSASAAPNRIAGAADTGIRLATSAQSNLNPVGDDVIVNPIVGTVTVTATDGQHNLVQGYLNQVQSSAQRQVLIEATIVEVKLSDQYQAGVDWSRLAITGGITLQQTLLAGRLGTAPAFAIGYSNPNSPIGNIASAIRLLEQFGTTRVISSPKLMAMNNQTALLKVVDDIVYFQITAQPAILLTSTTGAKQGTFTTTAHTLEAGLVMSLTPQINEQGLVMLGVRPSITRLLGFVNDPNPALAEFNVVSRIPQLQKREIESILQVGSGQTVVLGGLMQDTAQRTRDAVPGIGNPEYTGPVSGLFGFRDELASKTELVIFLRPTVITNASLDSDELKMFRRYLPQPEQPQTSQATGNAP
jgi:general secretion pathway protein D